MQMTLTARKEVIRQLIERRRRVARQSVCPSMRVEPRDDIPSLVVISRAERRAAARRADLPFSNYIHLNGEPWGSKRSLFRSRREKSAETLFLEDRRLLSVLAWRCPLIPRAVF